MDRTSPPCCCSAWSMQALSLGDVSLSPEWWKSRATFCFQVIAGSQAVKFDLENLQRCYFEEWQCCSTAAQPEDTFHSSPHPGGALSACWIPVLPQLVRGPRVAPSIFCSDPHHGADRWMCLVCSTTMFPCHLSNSKMKTRWPYTPLSCCEVST